MRKSRDVVDRRPARPPARAAAAPPKNIGARLRGSIGGSSLFERMERDANSSIDSSDDEASTSSGFATLLAGRAPPADPGQAPPGFHEEMAARMGIPRPADAADPEEDA